MSRKIMIAAAVLVLIGLSAYGAGIVSQLIYAAVSWLGDGAGLGQGLAGVISDYVGETEPVTSEPLNIGQPGRMGEQFGVSRMTSPGRCSQLCLAVGKL